MYNPGGLNYDLDFRCNIEGIKRSIRTKAGFHTFAYYTTEENYEIELLFSYQGREIDRITYSDLWGC